MADELTPIVHLRIRARELLTEQLSIEGVSEAPRADADELARQLCSGGTNDVVMSSIQEILPAAAFKELLAFCQREYPLSFTMLYQRGKILYPDGQRVKVPARNRLKCRVPRSKVFCWNAGGLYAEGTAELEKYLESCAADIALVQETH